MTIDLPLFFGASLLLLAAHVVRCYRQTLLFPDQTLPWRFDLLLGLAIGQAVNVLLPWRAGDLLRVLYVAVRNRLRYSYVAATVVTERLSDLVVVAGVLLLIASAGYGGQDGAVARTAWTLAGLAAVLLLAAGLLARQAQARRAVWWAGGLFNATIRNALVDFAWSYVQLVSSRVLIHRRYLTLSGLMWAMYFASYFAVARSCQVPALDVVLVLLGGPNRSLLQQIAASDPSLLGWALFVFASLPVLAVLLYGSVRNSSQFWRSFGLVRRYGFKSLSIGQSMTGDRFRDRANYVAFLESHFAGSNAIVSKFALLASAGVVVHKLLPGGSDAVTALVETENVLKIRKCATGNAGDKLEEQARWLRSHDRELPLCAVIGESRRDGIYAFDMPYLLTARDFYEMIHTAPVQESDRLLADVIEQQVAFHARTARGEADAETLDAYLTQKVIANAREVHAFASALFPNGRYRINGVEHDLAQWQALLDIDWLRGQITSRGTAVIHGDLTIENIIVSSEVERGWYLIDPNPNNVFNTPLIDWAKLMQSLHLGYEGLNRGTQCEVDGADIRQLFLRSGAYGALHAAVSERLLARFGAAVMREIAFHELVNYLRLTPYKIRHHPERAVTFFACTSLLLHEYLGGGTAAPHENPPTLVPVLNGSA